jgi:hypothetical protein
MSKTQKKVQAEKFRQKARELECDEDEAAFDDKLGRLVKHKTHPEKEPKNQ